MAKVLIIINGAGLILNVLVFFLVVHYFSGPGGGSPGGIGAAGASAPGLSAADLDRELSNRFTRFESRLLELTRKVDNIYNQVTRPAVTSPISSRPGRTRIEPAPERRLPGQAAPVEEMPAEELPEQPAGQDPLPVEGQDPDPGNQQPVEEPLPEDQGLPGQPQGGGR